MAEPLNPFLRAFSQSSIRTQCNPADYAILAPTYESLVDAFDRESRSWYTDLVRTEDFIASHVIRTPLENGGAKENGGGRENRNKPRQYYTANGRVIIIRDSSVFAAKGFKWANQAQIIGDGLWYRDGQKQEPWPVIYLHRPLVGNYEPQPIQTAMLPSKVERQLLRGHAESSAGGPGSPRDEPLSDVSSPSTPTAKRPIRSFVELLASFPQIERSLRPHLERIFKTLKEEVERPTSPQSLSGTTAGKLSRVNTATSDMSSMSGRSRTMSIRSMRSSLGEQIPVLEMTREEEIIRSAVDNAIRSAIDAFQNIDRSYLSHLTSTTDLEGPALDAMIERFILERTHGLYLFHKICVARQSDELQVDFRKIKDVDPTQVGVEVDDDRDSRLDLAVRLAKGVEEFRKLAVANSPHWMLEILNETLRILTTPAHTAPPSETDSLEDSEESSAEKQNPAMSFNADTLVSLLLAVVIRSNVQHLKSRLSYMRHFIFCEDVDSGVNGYALSTLEVVLSYLSRETATLMETARQNRKLWSAIKHGNTKVVRHMLGLAAEEEEESDDLKSDDSMTLSSSDDAETSPPSNGAVSPLEDTALQNFTLDNDKPPLSPVSPPTSPSFPSQADRPSTLNLSDATAMDSRRRGRHISFAPSTNGSRSFSLSSIDSWESGVYENGERRGSGPLPSAHGQDGAAVGASLRHGHTQQDDHPRTTDLIPTGSGKADSERHGGSDAQSGIRSIRDAGDQARLRTPSGASIARLAIESHQKEELEHILNGLDYWQNPNVILQDCDNSFHTLLMAAVRTGETPIVKVIMDRLDAPDIDSEARKRYINAQDSDKRAVGHYLYDYRPLILALGNDIDWQLKDSAGRTPLVSICRSYDSLDYRQMVEDALLAAAIAQGDSQPLYLDDHIDDRGNSLLHILTHPHLVRKVLSECSCDINAVNAKQYTPLITAAKFGRLDIIRVLFSDARLNPFFKDSSGLMAVEQAKSESVRQLIDDLTLLRFPPLPDGRMTGIVRVSTDRNGATSLLLKHTVDPPNFSSVTICTSWRSLVDFQQLISCLSAEQPASWLPELNVRPLRLPPSVASRTGLRIDVSRWLNTLLSHPSFGKHELVWEFFLLPELDWKLLKERSKCKAEVRAEAVRDNYEPIDYPEDIVRVIQTNQVHAGEVERGLNGVVRRSRALEQSNSDVALAYHHYNNSVSTLGSLSPAAQAALRSASHALAPPDGSPQAMFSADTSALATAASSLSKALDRIPRLVGNMHDGETNIANLEAGAKRSERMLPGFLADTRARVRAEADKKVEEERKRLDTLGREVAASRDTVVNEMAGLELWREREVKSVLKRFAGAQLRVEKERLRKVEAALRTVRKG